MLEGPLRIGDDSEVRPGAYLRGGVWVGDGCVVGTNTEVKRAILLAGAKAPHLNYVGDSILGANVNLGAGTILSNFRHDGAEIEIPDGGRSASPPAAASSAPCSATACSPAATACSTPACVVGAGTQIYPGVMLRPGFYPPHHLVKLRQDRRARRAAPAELSRPPRDPAMRPSARYAGWYA